MVAKIIVIGLNDRKKPFSNQNLGGSKNKTRRYFPHNTSLRLDAILHKHAQAYLHLTKKHPAARWKGALLFGQHRRNRFASRKRSTDISYKEQQEPGTRVVEFGDGAVRAWRDVELARDHLKSSTRPNIQGHNVDKDTSRQQMNAAQDVAPDNLRIEAHEELFSQAGGGKRRSVAETLEVTGEAFEGHSSYSEDISTKLDGVDQKRRPTTSLLESSAESSRPINRYEFYPSQRPSSAKAKAPVSLISPRTWKKIRYLPPPGQIERDTLQVNKFNRLLHVCP